MSPRSLGLPVDVTVPPDVVHAVGAEGEIPLHADGDGAWSGGGVVVEIVRRGAGLAVRLRAAVPLVRIQLRWHGGFPPGTRYLGDHWERSYGDLEWRGEVPERLMPWYVVAVHGDRVQGVGVATGAGAFCGWTADGAGLSLWADVRAAGEPVRLGDRILEVCDVLGVTGEPGESAFAVHRRFCRVLCAAPRLPRGPVFGANDWYVAYGATSRDLIRRTTAQVVDLSADAAGQPYSVIDDGWSQGGLGTGPWFGNDRFGDMGDMAAEIRRLGARPGIWYRPLTPLPDTLASWRLSNGCLDPSRPEVLDVVATQVRRLVGWGYELVKHDFSTFDLLGRWGFEMGGGRLTDDGRRLADPTRTTAEVLLALYRTLRDAAGDAMLLGCNTVGHLAAGLFELQRIGDDTSGVSWHRTRRMGVNTLAFRAAQHGTFFATDPDIAPVTPAPPWELGRRWLDLVARSGMPLFVSLDPAVRNPAVLDDVRAALAAASVPHPVAEPLDWFDTTCPTRWRLDGPDGSGGSVETIDWIGPDGASPFGG
jgi:alpha-galactosidase